MVSCGPKGKEKLFTLIKPEHSGVHFSNNLTESDSINYFLYKYLYMGGGVAIGDVNNDGLQDIYFTGNMVDNKLYLNKGDFKFEDISESANVTGDDRWVTGVTMADVNNDGWLDIYVSVAGYWTITKNLLYINNGAQGGKVSFTESAEEYGIADEGNSTQSVFFDYDLDGDLDLYVLNYPITDTRNGILNYRELMRFITPERSDHFYENIDGKFVDKTVESGIMRFGLSLGVVVSDFNKDGYPDLYVSNDFATPDYFFFNNGDGTFSNKIEKVTNHTAFYGMGVDAADINNDGLLDIFQVDMTPEDNFRSKANMGSMEVDAFWAMVNNGMYYQYMKNVLQLNQGQDEKGLPQFGDVSYLADAALTDWSWAPLIADFDNDGLKDFFITNGSRREINNKDFFKEMNKDKDQVKHYYDWVKKMPEEKIENYALKNEGNLNFKAIAKEWGINFLGWSNGASYGDLDNDGDLDLVVSNIDDLCSIYRNNSREQEKTNYLKVKLNGKNGNLFGLGSKITITQDKNIQYQEFTLTRGFQSSVEPLLHFGLGKSNINIDKVEVAWPDGRTQTFHNIEPNQTLVANYSDAVEQPEYNQVESDKIFKDITSQVSLNVKHTENVFDDFRHQVLLPHKMSQFGPALAVGDVNNDGMEDFYIGGAKGYSAALFLQTERGTFNKSNLELFNKEKGYEDVDAIFFHANNDYYIDLYVVSGGNEFKAQDPLYQDRLYINSGDGNFIKSEGALPLIFESGSVVRNADIDGDGDQDLFIGTRLSPRNYPLSGKSVLLENVSDSNSIRFIDITNKLGQEEGNIGMVTDAVWTDINKDDYADLVVTGEWMPITILVNNKGAFLTNKTNEFGLSENTGWWNTIQAADFDNDGDIDLVAGNLGNNYKYKASKKEPFNIYMNDYDGNNKSDIVLSYIQQGTEYPLRGRSCSSQQIPAIAIKFKDYNSFGKASLADVYSTKALEESLKLKAINFSTSYLENTGGSFMFKPFEKRLQISSVNAIFKDDINQDGHLDLVFAGNLYGSEVETPRNDASYGLYMQGDGKGKFKSFMPYESGLMIKGEVKKMKEIRLKGGKKAMLIAKNNDHIQLVELKMIP
ncbi:VCBS repeat-containing protein [Snuella sp. CAU 1569]|uniref:VCBS repeat-containing protein n=2 Tax=Snuella sedimenti TaxID=2798802 RepID=A0A8J7LP06_9FLAO|nr:VCBS repeat-containing protein [Snuella sedimenti]